MMHHLKDRSMTTQGHQRECHHEGNGEEKVLRDVYDREGKQPAKKPTPSTPPPTPFSTTSSPSNDFSFTISLHPSPPSSTTIKPRKSNTSSLSAVDFAPADDIFFHGHLLPLHLLTNPPVTSPRSSDFSIAGLRLPMEHGDAENGMKRHDQLNGNLSSSDTKSKSKPKSLSSFFGIRKWLKAIGTRESKDEEVSKKKEKGSFGISRFLKNVVEPLFSSKRDKSKRDLRRRPHSFSGRSNSKNSNSWRLRGEYSAPVSAITSPSNSGLLTSTGMASNEISSMDELQSAIQAAIVHCKNSSSNKEDKKCR